MLLTKQADLLWIKRIIRENFKVVAFFQPKKIIFSHKGVFFAILLFYYMTYHVGK